MPDSYIDVRIIQIFEINMQNGLIYRGYKLSLYRINKGSNRRRG